MFNDFLQRCYFLHTLRDSVSPVCRIFFKWCLNAQPLSFRSPSQLTTLDYSKVTLVRSPDRVGLIRSAQRSQRNMKCRIQLEDKGFSAVIWSQLCLFLCFKYFNHSRFIQNKPITLGTCSSVVKASSHRRQEWIGLEQRKKILK